MKLTIKTFKLIDTGKVILSIGDFSKLTKNEASILREKVEDRIKDEFDVLYLDTLNVIETNLYGINEIIHLNYLLLGLNKKLVLVYRINSEIENWVRQTGLNSFVESAIVIGA